MTTGTVDSMFADHCPRCGAAVTPNTPIYITGDWSDYARDYWHCTDCQPDPTPTPEYYP